MTRNDAAPPLLLQGTRWIGPHEVEHTGPVAIREGRIDLDPPEDLEARTLDLEGCWLLPGFIDAHVHLREPGEAYKEGIARGTCAAARGGVTGLLDMPDNHPPTTTERRLEDKHERFARKSRVNWSLFSLAGARPPRQPPEGAVAGKVFLSPHPHTTVPDPERTLPVILRRFPIVAVHAEDGAVIEEAAAGGGNRSWHERHPRKAVTRSLEHLETALRALDPGERPRLVLCHVSTKEEVEWLERMKILRFDVWGEAAFPHLFFTQDQVMEAGASLRIRPPIRTAADREAIRNGLARGIIDFVASNHAPHTQEERSHPEEPLAGIAGAECFAPLLLELHEEGLLTRRQVVDVGSGRPRSCYRLGGVSGIWSGARADLVAMRRLETPRAPESVTTGAEDHPYRERPFRWEVAATLVGGQLAWMDGDFPEDVVGERLDT